MNIINGMEIVSRNVKNYITLENTTDGILEDVETIIKSVNNEDPIETPCVWIVEHPTVPYNSEADMSLQQRVSTTFEFVCIDYDDDLETAQIKATNLATRVGASILKNRTIRESPTDPERIFQKILFKSLYPVGEVNVEGKLEKVPASSLVLEFIHTIDWMKCCNQS